MKQNIIYTDGVRPDELNGYLRRFSNCEWFFENDLTKQDRQTDQPIIDLEFMLYELLGVNPEILKDYKQVHGTYRFKGNLTSGKLKGMRTTG